MRRLIALAFVTAAACAPVREPVEVHWTFGGQPCDAAGVVTIRVDIAGEILDPNTFTCAEAGGGAALGSYLTGNYDLTVTGLDAGGNVIFQAVQTIQVRGGGKNVFDVDAVSTTGSVTLHWTFAGQSCAQAGVASVRVSVDDQVITDANNSPDLPCTSAGIDGTTVSPLGAGAHTIAVAAQGSSDDYSVDNIQVTVTAGQDTVQPVDLPAATPTTASADVRWTFTPGSQNCSQIGADHISVVFDPNSDGSGGRVVADTACVGVNGPVSEMNIVDVPDGNHTFAIRATKNNNLVAYTHHPGPATLFTAPFTTEVNVTAEPLP